VYVGGGKRTVVDGPFAETKELVAGYWIWQVRSMEEAVEWAKRCPDPGPGDEGELELRPVFETRSSARSTRPSCARRDQRLRAEIERQRRS
jgi:hypothetical protein